MENVKHLNNIGIDYAELGQYDLAVVAFTKAIEAQPNYGESFYNRGCVYSKKGQYDRAIADYNSAISLDERNVDALNNRGIAKQKSGDLMGGDADIERARRLRRADGSRYLIPIPQRGSERHEFMVNHPFLYVWQENGLLAAILGQAMFWILCASALMFIWIATRLLR